MPFPLAVKFFIDVHLSINMVGILEPLIQWEMTRHITLEKAIVTIAINVQFLEHFTN